MLLAGAVHTLTDADIGATREPPPAPTAARSWSWSPKYTEARSVLPGLLDAMAAIPAAQLAIKTHPAETPEPSTRRSRRDGTNVRVLPASAPLAPLLRAAQAVVTVNSTVALDAMSLGIPALSIGLPNNLTPFVEAGAMAGAAAAGEIGPALQRLLYDEGFRQQFCSTSAQVGRGIGHVAAPDAPRIRRHHSSSA